MYQSIVSYLQNIQITVFSGLICRVLLIKIQSIYCVIFHMYLSDHKYHLITMFNTIYLIFIQNQNKQIYWQNLEKQQSQQMAYFLILRISYKNLLNNIEVIITDQFSQSL
ncbi:hypothetical protein pb186bvf_009064 [Paramecium bursaria]